MGFWGFGIRSLCAGEEDGDGGAVGGGIGVALDGDGTAVFFDEAFADPEAEAGALLSLGGEEGLKELGEGGFGDAGTGIGDGDEDAGGSGFGVEGVG